jgi:hypothetical protein
MNEDDRVCNVPSTSFQTSVEWVGVDCICDDLDLSRRASNRGVGRRVAPIARA